MQNRFGVKDAALFLMVLVVLVMTFLTMRQSDRQFLDAQQLESRVGELDRVLSRLNTSIESFDRTLERLADGGVTIGTNAGTGGGSADDESWAVPGIEITRYPLYTFTTDPRESEDFETGGSFMELYEAQMKKCMPFIGTDVYSRRITDLVFEYLGAYNPQTLQLDGRLAAAVQQDPGGMWLRVRLHDNARFSDGEPLTADDVVFTWNDFIFNPAIQADRQRSISEGVESVVEIDEHTVEFRFREPLFSNFSIAMNTYVLPRHFYERFTPSQINEATSLVLGSGPMRLDILDVNDQWVQGEDLVLARNEAYWAGVTAPLEEMRFRVIEDQLARFTSFVNGEGDLVRPSSAQFKDRATEEDGGLASDPEFLEENDSLKWLNMRSGYSFIAWQCGPRRVDGPPTPFADKRVRRAMTHLLDRQYIIDTIFEGIGAVATGPEISTSPAHSPNVQPLEYNIERARELLAEAGWIDRDGDGRIEREDGTRFSFAFTYTRGNASTDRIASYLQSQCALVGIDCTLDIVEWAQLLEQLDTRDFDAITLAWSKNAPESDPRQMWHSTSMVEKGDNFIQWSSPEADRVIDEGRLVLDTDERMKYWHRVHEIIHEEQPYTFLIERPWLRFVKRRVGNLVEYPEGIQYTEFFAKEPAAF